MAEAVAKTAAKRKGKSWARGGGWTRVHHANQRLGILPSDKHRQGFLIVTPNGLGWRGMRWFPVFLFSTDTDWGGDEGYFCVLRLKGRGARAFAFAAWLRGGNDFDKAILAESIDGGRRRAMKHSLFAVAFLKGVADQVEQWLIRARQERSRVRASGGTVNAIIDGTSGMQQQMTTSGCTVATRNSFSSSRQLRFHRWARETEKPSSVPFAANQRQTGLDTSS